MTKPFDVMTTPFGVMTNPFDVMAKPFDVMTKSFDVLRSADGYPRMCSLITKITADGNYLGSVNFRALI